MTGLKHWLVAIALLGGASAQASFLIEPIIGYNKGQQQASALQGIGLGLRLGWDGSFLLALDAEYADVQQATLNSVKYTNTGVVIGGTIDKIRLWYGHIASSSFSYPSGTSTNTYQGSGSKIGLSAAVSGSMHVNLEFKSLNFSTASIAGTETPISELGTVGTVSLSWVL